MPKAGDKLDELNLGRVHRHDVERVCTKARACAIWRRGGAVEALRLRF